MASIFCDTTNVVVAKTFLLSQVIQIVVIGIPDVHTFTCAYPYQTTRILEDLRDIIVGILRQIRRVTRILAHL